MKAKDAERLVEAAVDVTSLPGKFFYQSSLLFDPFDKKEYMTEMVTTMLATHLG